jgi:hypothetical protein
MLNSIFKGDYCSPPDIHAAESQIYHEIDMFEPDRSLASFNADKKTKNHGRTSPRSALTKAWLKHHHALWL